MNVPLDIKNKFDRSESVTAHVTRRLGTALRMYAPHIRGIEVRLSDVNGPRHGSNDKLTQISVSLDRHGQVVTSASADDVYASVAKAAARARQALGRHIERRVRRRQRRPR